MPVVPDFEAAHECTAAFRICLGPHDGENGRIVAGLLTNKSGTLQTGRFRIQKPEFSKGSLITRKWPHARSRQSPCGCISACSHTVASFIKIRPHKINSTATIRAGVAASPNTVMPRTNAPIAPMPVQIV
jgi:hypothetical protein